MVKQNDELVTKLKRLSQSSDKLTALIDELVQSYDPKQMEKEEQSSFVDFDLVAIARDAISLQQPLADQVGSKLSIDVPAVPVIIKGKPTDVSRVMDNLLRNALLHNPHETEVRLSLTAENGTVVVEVMDNGRGIPSTNLERIFESGYRCGNSDADGQGLGLNIVKTMTERNGGTISVKSEVGRGTTFRLEWSTVSPVSSNHGSSENDPLSVGKV